MSQLCADFIEAKKNLKAMAHEVIICEFTGLSFANYYIGNNEFAGEQIELDNAHLQINDYINDLNSKTKLATPRTACHVHKWRHNRIGRWHLE